MRSNLASEPKEAFTLTLRCFDKHTIRKDKFLGQFTVAFNSQLVSSTEAVEQWFPLAARTVRGARERFWFVRSPGPQPQETVSGSVHLRIQYGDLKSSATGLDTKSSVAAQLGLACATACFVRVASCSPVRSVHIVDIVPRAEPLRRPGQQQQQHRCAARPRFASSG